MTREIERYAPRIELADSALHTTTRTFHPVGGELPESGFRQKKLNPMSRTLHSLGFLVKGPLILAFLFLINLMTSPGHWWVQWPALGIGIAWMFSLFRVIRAVVVLGGLAGLAAYLSRQR